MVWSALTADSAVLRGMTTEEPVKTGQNPFSGHQLKTHTYTYEKISWNP
jgi:hypothetical protein